MKLSINWLKDFIKAGKLEPEKLAELLTLSGTEVERIKKAGPDLAGVVVGEIKTIVRHSNADKLKVCKVRVKKGRVLSIVCGAPNIKVGQKVPVAMPGAKLPSGIVLEKTKIRGVESEGMLLAEDEMGLGDDHEGIYILEDKARIGQSVKSVLGFSDLVFDIALTPNRADCYSVLGLAREAAAASKRKLNFDREKYRIKDKSNEIGQRLSVKVAEAKLCPKYTARVIENLEVKESPEWLKNRLRASGLRPINNLVDATNYVMLELGQPLHAFDYDKLGGAKKSLVVRRANKKEKITTLDGQARELDSNMLLISEGKKPLALAGVMGGRDSEISGTTKAVILESAVFEPSNVRKTALALNLRSESEMRFEKGLDPEMTALALDRAASLLAKLGGGRVVPGMIDISSEPQAKPATISLPLSLIKKSLNINIAEAKVKLMLKSLGFEMISSKEKTLKIQVPSWRADVRLPEDLVEEIGRLYDYNKLKPTYLKGLLKPVSLPRDLAWTEKLRDLACLAGLVEVYNYSFYSAKVAAAFGLPEEEHYEVANPLNLDQEYLRRSLLPLLFKNLQDNQDQAEGLAFFEIGPVFMSGPDLPQEKIKVAAVFSGQEAFFKAKGFLDFLASKLNIGGEEKEKLAEIKLAGQALLERFKLKKEAAYFETDLVSLVRAAKEKKSYQKIARHPAVTRDLSFFKPASVSFKAIEKEIIGASDLIKDLSVFDRFSKDGQVSLAVRLTFQADRTLKGEEVDSVMKEVYEILEGKFNIKVRK